ncbi:MAG: DUF3135 domain-containing protein [Gammaproteobacteria bacterium]
MEKQEKIINKWLDPFDFDYWCKLAEDDPESFEHLREHMIRELINSSPAILRPRLRGLQWRIDMEIRLSKNAVDRCIRINRMMMNSVYANGGLIETLRNLVAPEVGQAPALARGLVIPFRRQN